MTKLEIRNAVGSEEICSAKVSRLQEFIRKQGDVRVDGLIKDTQFISYLHSMIEEDWEKVLSINYFIKYLCILF